MRIIKAYAVVLDAYKLHANPLPYDDDLAIAQFRAFFPVASEHTARATTDFARNIMREVLETLLNDLDKK